MWKKAIEMAIKKFGNLNTAKANEWLMKTYNKLKSKPQSGVNYVGKSKDYTIDTLLKKKFKKVPPSRKGKVVDPFKKKVAPSNVVDLKWWKKMRDRGDFQKGGRIDKALPKRSRDI